MIFKARGRRVGLGGVDRILEGTVVHRHNGLNPRRVIPVDNILWWSKRWVAGMATAPNLCRARRGEPKLVPALEDQHDPGRPCQSRRLRKKLAALSLYSFNSPKLKLAFFSLLVTPDQCGLLRLKPGPFINHVIGKS